MKRIWTCFFALITIVFFSQNLLSQQIDLVKLRKQEQERRKKLKKSNSKSKITVTNSSLRQYSKKNKVTSNKTSIKTSKKKPVSRDTKATKKEPKPKPETTQEYWKSKAKSLRTKILSLESQIKMRSHEIKELDLQYNLIDEHYQQKEIEDKILKSEGMIKKLAADRDKTKNELEDLKVQARKSGIPPGWLRE